MAVDELKAIVGKDNVLDTPEILQEYAADESFAPRKVPACIVRPADIEALNKVVQWANQGSTATSQPREPEAFPALASARYRVASPTRPRTHVWLWRAPP